MNLLQQQQENQVPEHCATGYSYDEATNQYHIPILSESCLVAILKKPPTYILTAGDLGTLGSWWAEHNEDAHKYNDGSAWSLLQGAYLSELAGTPIANAPDDDFTVERNKLPTEDISNSISRAFNFFIDPTTWLALLGLAVGSLMVIYAVPRVTQRAM